MFGFPPAGHFSPTRWLAVGDTVQIGKSSLHVRHCPDHTPGHVVFHSPQAKRAFVGDVLFAGSIGRTDFPQGNHKQLISSIRERLWTMGDDTVLTPGHGPQSTFGQERRSNGRQDDTYWYAPEAKVDVKQECKSGRPVWVSELTSYKRVAP